MTQVTPIPKPGPKVSAKGRKQKGSRLERHVARSLGGKRMPLSGAVGGGDVVAAGFSVECKARAELPALIRDAFNQAESDIATGDPRRPLVVLRADRSEAVYCLKESDFLAVLNDQGPQNAFHIRELCRNLRNLADQIEGLAK